MRLLKTGLLGLMVMIVLACSPTSTGTKTRDGAEGGPCSPGGACAPDLVCVDSVCAKLADTTVGRNDGSLTAGSLDEDASSTSGPQARIAMTALEPQWVQTNWSASNSFFSLYTSQAMVFARTWDALNGGRMFLTSDNGATWTQIGSADTDMDILSVAVPNGNVLAGTWNGFYLSTSGGTSWTAVTPAGVPADASIRSIATIGTSLFAVTTGHVYRSSDSGNTWTEVSSGIPVSATITSIVGNANAIFAGGDSNGVFVSTNGGTTWTATNSGLADTHVSQLAAIGARLFAVTLNGVFVSDNNGTSWAASSSTPSNLNCFLVASDQLFAGTDSSGVYLSTDSGATWTAFSTGMPAGTRVWSLALGSDSVFAGTDSGVWRTPSTTVPNSPPTVATAAAASPNPVAGTATSLSVLGADDGSEANLTYTWAVTGAPPAAVTFSANGSNVAKNTTAPFTKPGGYTFQVTVRDQPGLTATSTVVVTVDQTLTSIAVAPTSSTLAPLAAQQFVATARDQFASALATQPTFTWNVSGGGTIDANGLFTAESTVGGPYTVTAQSAAVSGAATISVAIPNAAPTISSPAAAAPNPVAGNATSLLVLGSDDAGEANLIYTWATNGSPPAAVTFSANGSNAAKNTTATFTKAGIYALQVTVADQPGLSVTSSLTVTVNQTPTTIVVSPTSATVNTSASQQWSATARDQFGTNLATQPTFAWTVSGGGTIGTTGLFTAGSSAGGPYVVTATSGSSSGTASVTVSSTPTTVYQINCGSSSAASPFTPDQYGSGGTQHTVTNSITISGITNPAPMAVYQSERYGNSTYTLASLTAGSQYKVRLHFAELYQTATGKRVFNVVINGTTVLSNFDLYATAGARYKAVLREFTATASSSGQIVINFNTVTDNATIGGIELIAQTPNNPPSIVTAAAATPNPVSGTTTSLSVLGSDDGGEASLTYTWATTGTPPAAVAFSANGTNAAKTTTATFTKAGSYTFQATVKDQPGLTATSNVVVTVNQTLTSILVAPASSTIASLASQQFVATARDQFTTNLATQPTFTWTVSGGGTIDASGLFAATVSSGGPYTVTAASGGVSGTATVSVSAPNAGPTIATPAAASPSPVAGSTTALSVLGADDGGEANLTYTWGTTGTPPASVTFSANGTNAAKASTATFTKAGSYTFQLTIKDQGNLTATSSVSVTVNQTLTSIAVSPTSATVNTSATQPFSATARDQFATSLTTQPAFTWSVSGGGTISSSGLFTAGSTAGGPYTITAQNGGKSGTASVTVAQATVYQINCGGSASSPYTADQYGSGGTARTVTNSITTTGVTNPAPQAVYQAERYGAVTYTLPSLTAGAAYTVRLHFAELYWTATGKRKFNVAINGTTVLSSYDIYAATGAIYKAVIKEFTATANASGQIVISLTNVTDNATIEGIQIIRQ